MKEEPSPQPECQLGGVRSIALLAIIFRELIQKQMQLLVAVEHRGKVLNEIVLGSRNSKESRNLGHVIHKSLFGVCLQKLMELDKISILAGCLAILLASSLQFAGKAVENRLVNESVRPVSDPTRLVLRCFKCVAVKSKQGNIELVLKSLLPRNRNCEQNPINGTEAFASIAKCDNQPETKLLGLLGALGEGEEKRDLVKIQPVISLWPPSEAVRKGFSGFNPENPQLLKGILVSFNLLAKMLVGDSENLGDIARVGKKIIALVADGDQFFHLGFLFNRDSAHENIFLANVPDDLSLLASGAFPAQAGNVTEVPQA